MSDLVRQEDARALPGFPRAMRERFGFPGVGITGRLFVLIVIFVLTAQVMIFVPAVANMRFNWLRSRLAAAYTAALTLDLASQRAISPEISNALLKSVGARSIVLDTGGTRRVLAAQDRPGKVDDTFDLRVTSWPSLVANALEALWSAPDRVSTYITAAPPGGDALEVTMDQAPLTEAMHSFARRIMIYSFVVSGVVATLVALSLNRMILRPMRRLTTSIVDFGFDPVDRKRIITPSRTSHEIGQAERALALMQEALAGELAQKKHLADLGLAVAKINHDMRNMLSSAQILSDRLANVTDPLAQRLAPKLVATLDRAIRFCQATLTYGRAADEPPRPRSLKLRGLVSEAAEMVAPIAHSGVRIDNQVPDDCVVTADPEQLFRILMNLMRNGVEALERAGASHGRIPMVSIKALRRDSLTEIIVSDTGPGIPPMTRPKVFSAFQNSSRPGGTGLGLAIVADLVRAHGGTIELMKTDDDVGASFRILLP